MALGRGPADRQVRCGTTVPRGCARKEGAGAPLDGGGETGRLGIQARRERTRGDPWDRQQENDLSFLSPRPGNGIVVAKQ